MTLSVNNFFTQVTKAVGNYIPSAKTVVTGSALYATANAYSAVIKAIDAAIEYR